MGWIREKFKAQRIKNLDFAYAASRLVSLMCKQKTCSLDAALAKSRNYSPNPHIGSSTELAEFLVVFFLFLNNVENTIRVGLENNLMRNI
ncbi:hypothetical protein LEWO105114_06120 [Legionella worsleiensis]|uniref:Uncharacterized protein n=1 Tax=Legionella worsleiensis TaxID=45076 RepID=A0A0W1A6K5_9GAMM|nr:hypothetical protein Lwor_2179 [Legionella worsleiensis]STY33375.1 Uncharacterised protein [Legionella worsleiensis]